jgi:hypothetical protein
MSRNSRSQLAAAAVRPSPFHSAFSQHLVRARTTPISPASASASASPSPDEPSSAPALSRSRELPSGEYTVLGEAFEVRFGQVYLGTRRLPASRLGYKVRHKSTLKGGRTPSAIWRHGVELEFEEDDGTPIKLWLCKLCHLKNEVSNAKVVSGTRHIHDHMVKLHRIDPSTGFLPETPQGQQFLSPFEAAKTPGSGSYSMARGSSTKRAR